MRARRRAAPRAAALCATVFLALGAHTATAAADPNPPATDAPATAVSEPRPQQPGDDPATTHWSYADPDGHGTYSVSVDPGKRITITADEGLRPGHMDCAPAATLTHTSKSPTTTTTIKYSACGHSSITVSRP
ncbi:hypothetical protein ABT160_35740 [Streptomyces sp. NPDC001941]|uniref:hypothetical protein n=1 Tax=Streptomyces sp. NPDC001941 TaxID=3154659 RepID=UPI00333229BC